MDWLKMIEEIIILGTSISAVLVVYIKKAYGLLLSTIKVRYKCEQGEMELIEILANIICAIVIGFEIVLVGMILYLFFSGDLEVSSGNTNKIKNYDGFISFITYTVIIIILLLIAIFIILRKSFIDKFEDIDQHEIKGPFINIKKIIKDNYLNCIKVLNKVCKYVSMGIGILFLIIGIMLCKENSLENGVMILALFFLMITTGIIFIGFNGVIEILDGSYEYFILTKDGKEIKADIILRYNEFYLIFKNKTEKYISKSEIKEIDRKYKGKVN